MYLKVGCPIILIVNLSDELVNGLEGKVCELYLESVVCFFPSIKRKVEIGMHYFKKYSVEMKKDIGCRKQLPLSLAFAFTVHKSQGMTIDRISIDCSNMFQYGQLAVAVSRARNKRESLPIQENFACCVESHVIPQEDIERKQIFFENFENTDMEELNSDDEPELIEMIDKIDKSWAESDIEHEISENFNFEHLLLSLYHKEAVTDQQINENQVLAFLQENLNETKQFLRYLWNKTYPLIQKYFTDKTENKSINEFYKQFNKIVSSDEYNLKLTKLFSQNPSPAQYNIAFQIHTSLRLEMLQQQSTPIITSAVEEAKSKKGTEFQESAAGRGKIRYLAGWCISRVKKLKMRKLSTYLYKRDKVDLVKQMINDKDLLQHLEGREGELLKYSLDKASLKETMRRQNVRHGLTNVNDKCFEYFLLVDKLVTSLQTVQNLNLHGEKFYAHLTSELYENETLAEKWHNLFEDFNKKEELQNQIKALFSEVIEKYCMMSVAQLRKEYLRNLEVKKREATRKQIKIKSAKVKKDKFDMETLASDKTDGKAASHKRLQSELLKDSTFLEENFKKTELVKLCQMYQVKQKSSHSKKHIADLLKPIVIESSHIPSLFIDLQTTEAPESPIPSSSVSNIQGCSTSMLHTEESVKVKKRKIGVGKGKGKRRKTSIVKWPCGICGDDANFDSVGCDGCDTWFHGTCLKIENLDDLPSEWFCENCKEEGDIVQN
ncbi:hypothetical protein KUTeg_009289 [Tegillarca granosa]|uniref:PHD-type domain-containing protein n=1 Tax=Tegillarca granosa TaxID=220873 RepID=A0ABQ9F731_TEGGR|nr:hypothetical protein KUTeg_009289 [Tegillarca granosa]